MIANIKPCNLKGTIDAPPSKSLAHRYLIGAFISNAECRISGVDFSEDILASKECLKALGADVTVQNDAVSIRPRGFMHAETVSLNCRESGSTLRFLLPLALCLGKPVTLKGSKRLFERPLTVYEDLAKENGFLFEKSENAVTVCGTLQGGTYKVRGDISSQFITGLIFAFLYLGEEAELQILPPFESKPYVHLTISALKAFGADVAFLDEYTIQVKKAQLHAFSGKIEGDYSNAAFLDAFNYTGSDIKIHNLIPDSVQGDKVYKTYFEKIQAGTPTLDISDCPDLAPVLIALASLKNGATLLGTNRLKEKESDRGRAMHEELKKLGGGLVFSDNAIVVPKQELFYKGTVLDGHNDHRIVMAMSFVLTHTGGEIAGIEAVKKSYPGFFDDLLKLGAVVDIT